ncbi:DUF5676 family membrane protein [Novosphingobium naphthalenivorans]|uniref:DUF5676 family membrane protein n=1 Tax=Novosphingobium naphthalenivorans TaxID=273168 RepID=UPI00082F4361|nr:DUF5676 family membrane protein [Novosphingobium naphthalenivorans]
MAAETSSTGTARTVPVLALGMALSLFLVISYLLCIALYFLSPGMVEGHAMLVLFLPGFKLLSLPSFILGLVESFGYGWFIALVFAPIYNFFVVRWP